MGNLAFNTVFIYFIDDVRVELDFDIPRNVLRDDIVICANSGTPTVLNATNLGAFTYLWNNLLRTFSRTITQSGTYWVQMVSPECIRTDTITVLYKPVSTIELGSNRTACIGDTIFLGSNFPPTTAVLWNTSERTNFIKVANSGKYFIETDRNGCLHRDTITFKFVPKPSVHIGSDKIICLGDSIKLRSAFHNSTYSWSNGSSDSVITAKVANFYWLQVSNDGCLNRDTMYLKTITELSVNLGADISFCSNLSAKLRPTIEFPDFTYAWNNGSSDSAITVNQSGKYWLTLSQGACASTDTINVVANTVPVINLGNDTTICTNQIIVLNAQNTGAQFLWSDNSTSQLLPGVTSGTYWVSVSQNNCFAYDTIVVNQNPKPFVELGNDTAFCENDSIIFDLAQPGASYKWHTGSTLFRYTVTQSEKVRVEVTRGACIVADSVLVSIVPRPNLNLGNDRSECLQPTAVLASNIAADGYLWNTGQTDSAITINTVGKYVLQIRKSVCIVSDSIVINQVTLPSVNIGSTPAICKEDSLLLDAQNASSNFEWSNLSNQQTIFATAPNTYWVKVTNQQGCIGADTLFLDTLVSPIVSIGNDTFVCKGSTMTLATDKPFATYIWSDGSSNNTLSITQNGTYSVVVNDQNNCQAKDAVVVNMRELPALNLATELKVCEPNLVLEAPANFSYYLWSTGQNSNSITITDYGIYTIEVGDAFKCVNSHAIKIESNCKGTVFVPNAFTPNGDGLNDGFIPQYKNVQSANLTIYDRRGQLLFETTNMQQPWNGTYNGLPSTSDVYVYDIKYTGANEQIQYQSGNITLLR